MNNEQRDETNLLQVLEILLLILLVGSISVEILKLSKVFLLGKNLLQSWWVLPRAEPGTRSIAHTIILYPLLRLLRDGQDFVDTNLSISRAENFLPSIRIGLNACRNTILRLS